jgi:hypothetical protein
MKKRRGAPQKTIEKKWETALKHFQKVMGDKRKYNDQDVRSAKLRLNRAFAEYGDGGHDSSGSVWVVTPEECCEPRRRTLYYAMAFGYTIEIARPGGRPPGKYPSPQVTEAEQRMHAYAENKWAEDQKGETHQRGERLRELYKEMRARKRRGPAGP